MADKMIRIKNKRGQVAMWVIIAVVFVALISLLFVFRQKPSIIEPLDYTNPNAFIETCTRKAVLDTESEMLKHGGFVNPTNTASYNNISVAYLCKHEGSFEPCIQQHPLYFNDLENELYNYTEQTINSCFIQLKEELEKRKNEVELREVEIKHIIMPQKIRTEIYAPLMISNKGGTNNYEKFTVEIESPLYEFASAALAIMRGESSTCYFEYVGYMVANKDIEIRKTTLGDSTRIYFISDLISGKTMPLAIRGCAIPPGL